MYHLIASIIGIIALILPHWLVSTSSNGYLGLFSVCPEGSCSKLPSEMVTYHVPRYTLISAISFSLISLATCGMTGHMGIIHRTTKLMAPNLYMATVMSASGLRTPALNYGASFYLTALAAPIAAMAVVV